VAYPFELHSLSSPAATIPWQLRSQVANLFVSLENGKAPPIPSIIGCSLSSDSFIVCVLLGDMPNSQAFVFGCVLGPPEDRGSKRFGLYSEMFFDTSPLLFVIAFRLKEHSTNSRDVRHFHLLLPVGKIASTNLSCAKCLVFDGVCWYSFVT
jgi:hypothetical protein